MISQGKCISYLIALLEACRASNYIQVTNPWIVPQTGFAQDNPGIAQIHALRVTYKDLLQSYHMDPDSQ